MVYMLISNWSLDFEKFPVCRSWFTEECGCMFFTNRPVTDADLERGRDLDREEELCFLKFCRFLDFYLKKER